ncbi:YdcF family protein [Noviherbaspirillum agri]
MNTSIILTKAISAMILPPLNLILLCLAGVMMRRRWPRFGATLSVSALLALVVISTPAGALLFVAPLEAQNPPLTATRNTGAQAIVVLGGGRIMNAAEYDGRDIPMITALARIRYAAHLHRETQLPLLTSGGTPDGRDESEAALMARILQQSFAVPVKWMEGKSNDTAQNAAFSAEMLKQAGIRRILLVTDAIHMPRSRAVFEKAGLDVVPAPTLYFSRGEFTPTDFMPSGEGLRRSEYALHEWVGMAWYRLK